MPPIADESREKILKFYTDHLRDLPPNGPEKDYNAVVLIVSNIVSTGNFNCGESEIVTLIKYFQKKIHEFSGKEKKDAEKVYDLITIAMWEHEPSRKRILAKIKRLEDLNFLWHSFLHLHSLADRSPNISAADLVQANDGNNLRILNFLQKWIVHNDHDQQPAVEVPANASQISLVNISNHLNQIIEVIAKSDNNFFVSLMSACRKFGGLENILICDAFLNHPEIRKKLLKNYLDGLLEGKEEEVLFTDSYERITHKIETDYNYHSALLELLAQSKQSDFVKFLRALTRLSEKKVDIRLEKSMFQATFWEHPIIRKKLLRAYVETADNGSDILFPNFKELITTKLRKHATYRAALRELIVENIHDNEFFKLVMRQCKKPTEFQSFLIIPKFLLHPDIRKKLLLYYLDNLMAGNECQTLFEDAYNTITNLIENNSDYYSDLLEIITRNNDAESFRSLMKACKNYTKLYIALFKQEFWTSPNITKKLVHCYLTALANGSECTEMFASAYQTISQRILSDYSYFTATLAILSKSSDHSFLNQILRACKKFPLLQKALIRDEFYQDEEIATKLIRCYFDALCEGNKCAAMYDGAYTKITRLIQTDPYYREACLKYLNRMEGPSFTRVMNVCQKDSDLLEIIQSRNFLKNSNFRKKLLTKYLDCFVKNNKPEEMFHDAYNFITGKILRKSNFLKDLVEILSELQTDEFKEIIGKLKARKDLQRILTDRNRNTSSVFLNQPSIRKKLVLIYLESVTQGRECEDLFEGAHQFISSQLENKNEIFYHASFTELLAENDDVFRMTMEFCNQNKALCKILINPTFQNHPIIRKKLLKFYLDTLGERGSDKLFTYRMLTEKIKTDNSYIASIFEIIAENDYAYLSHIFKCILKVNPADNEPLHKAFRQQLICPLFFEHPGVIKVLESNTFFNSGGENDPIATLLREEPVFAQYSLIYAHRLGLCNDEVEPTIAAVPETGKEEDLLRVIDQTGLASPPRRVTETLAVTARMGNIIIESMPEVATTPKPPQTSPLEKTKHSRSPMHPTLEKITINLDGLSKEGTKQYLQWAKRFSWFKRFCYWALGTERLKRWGWPSPPNFAFVNKLERRFKAIKKLVPHREHLISRDTRSRSNSGEQIAQFANWHTPTDTPAATPGGPSIVPVSPRGTRIPAGNLHPGRLDLLVERVSPHRRSSLSADDGDKGKERSLTRDQNQLLDGGSEEQPLIIDVPQKIDVTQQKAAPTCNII